MNNIAIFASGKGSNADNLCRYFENHPSIKVRLIISDRKDAGVFNVAEENKVESLYVNKDGWKHPENVVIELKKRKIDFIVLAGFLKLIPTTLIQAFGGRIINIHPALLPKYGGKGMFGMHVHEAVHRAKEKETGISIHHVNDHYDEGDIIFQAKTAIQPEDSPDDIANKIHQLEMKFFPKIVEEIILKSKAQESN